MADQDNGRLPTTLSHIDDTDIPELAQEQSPLAAHVDTGGCFTVIGPIQICWTIESGGAKVCLRIFGVEIVCANVGLDGCVTLGGGSCWAACAQFQVCLKRSGSQFCLTYAGKACVAGRCAETSGTIVCI